MLSRIFFACVFVGLYCACSPLNCRWMDHKFRQYSKNALDLLDMMANNSTNSTEDEEQHTVAFPHHLYTQVSKATAEGKLAFTVQILKEVCALFEEDDSSSSWQEITVEHFLNVVNKQADELHSCIKGHGHMKKKNTKLHLYFKRLSNEILKKMGHSAEAWELIRREIKDHLIRADHLVSSLLTSN
ncbi:interferon a3-like [Girardinichthys multiradiatus]|uniref:interferon a3-like n=1 Tax=Girardinichthys multiradiatus TaxID=208333 RepID=UPI001FACC82E|nr:interferon a3-like [Girardinichthys multiradiatus]